MLAARFKVQFIDAPVLEIVRESHDAHLLDQMQFTRPVEIEDGRKGTRMAVEKVFVVHEGVVVTEIHNGLVTVAVSQSTEASVWQSLQRSPQDLVTHSAYVDADATVESSAPHDHKRFWRQRRHRT